MKGVLIFLATLALCACVVVPVLYFTTDVFEGEGGGASTHTEEKVFTIEGWSEAVVPISCKAGEVIWGSFTVTAEVSDGEYPNDIIYWVEGVYGEKAYSGGWAFNGGDFELAAITSGVYKLHFANKPVSDWQSSQPLSSFYWPKTIHLHYGMR